MSLGLAWSGCGQPGPIAPVAPGLLALTPASASGLAATMEPTAGPSPTPEVNPTRIVEPPEPLDVPSGFGVGLYADEVGAVAGLAVSPSGDVFATVPRMNRILVLPDRDEDGVADRAHVYAAGGTLNQPYGLAFRSGWLYVGNTDGVVRYPYEYGDLEATAEPETLLPLPGEGLNAGRALLFDDDGGLFVSVGSSCNVCREDDIRRAAILKVEPDGAKVVRFATGVRKGLGLALDADGKTVWFTDNERDEFEEDRPPDEVNRLLAGADYGWPWCFGQREPDPTAGGDASLCQSTVGPVVELVAHGGAQGLTFYRAAQFPERYRGGLFVALHGSWSRAIPVGYSVVFLPFADGMPTGAVEPFVTGWLRPDTRRWASPADVVVAPDGALLVSDDGGGRVYRVYYDGPLGTPSPRFSR